MVDAEEEGVKGFAGLPIVASWWNASSSRFVTMASWSAERLLNYFSHEP